MTSEPNHHPEAAPDPTLRVGLIVVVGIAVLGVALMFGAGVGRRRAAEEERNDPIAALERERAAIEGEASALAPALHGQGEQPDPALVKALEARLADLIERAHAVQLPLDTIQIEAVVARAKFEALLTRGDEAALDEAALLLPRVGRRGEEPVLRARLDLARGREPDVSWLASWTEVDDAGVAEAARLLCATLYAARNPDRARRMVGSRVDERLAKTVLARIDLASAARRLDLDQVRLHIALGRPGLANMPRLRREIARVGVQEGIAAQPSYAKVERVLRIEGLLQGKIGSDGQRLARVAFVVARRSLVELDVEPAGRDRRVQALASLLDAIAGCGLRAGPSLEAGSFLDDLLGPRAPKAPQLLTAGVLAACRLDARLQPVHLRALAPLRATLLESSDPLLRAVALRLSSSPDPAAARAVMGALPPAQRSQLLLMIQTELPAGSDRLKLCQEALRLDPASPAAALAAWSASEATPPQDALARLSKQVRDLIRDRPLLTARGAELLGELAALQRTRGQPASAQATLREVERWFGAEARAAAEKGALKGSGEGPR
ncbi:MAG: hypothetical protein JKY65_33955 [Planctomycetes bacterium]|nr:hypothetical protein [Planctomycetota bacterium]